MDALSTTHAVWPFKSPYVVQVSVEARQSPKLHHPLVPYGEDLCSVQSCSPS